MTKSSYNIPLTENQLNALKRIIKDGIDRTIKEQHQIKEENKFDETYDADTRAYLLALTARLRDFDKILAALCKAKKN